MKIIIILLLSIKVTYLFELNSAYNNNTGLVYNGQKYNPKEYPYIVTIQISTPDKQSTSICTGSLIKPLYVLTAAHCVFKVVPSLLQVYSGSSLGNNDYRLVTEINTHENYNPKNYAVIGDLSLIKLKNSFKNVKKFITIGGKPEEFFNLKPVKCVCIGFGAINSNNILGLEGVMMTTDVRYGKKACREYQSDLIRKTWEEYLCAATPMKSMVCKGDSGGPMICNGKLYGICSFYYNYSDPSVKEDQSKRCGGPTMQTVHVFLHYHLEWINGILPPDKKKKKKKKKNSGNSLKAHLTLRTIIAILLYRVLTSI